MLPTNLIDLFVQISGYVLQGISANEAVQRLRNGVSAKAHAENRDVTPDEQEIINQALAWEEKRRRGEP